MIQSFSPLNHSFHPQQEEKGEEDDNVESPISPQLLLKESLILGSELDQIKDKLTEKYENFSYEEVNSYLSRAKFLSFKINENFNKACAIGSSIKNKKEREEANKDCVQFTGVFFKYTPIYSHLKKIVDQNRYLVWTENDYPIGVQKIRLSLLNRPAKNDVLKLLPVDIFATFFNEKEIAKNLILTNRSWAKEFQSSVSIRALFNKFCININSFVQENGGLFIFGEIREQKYPFWVADRKKIPYSLIELHLHRGYFRSLLLPSMIGRHGHEFRFSHPMDMTDAPLLANLVKKINNWKTYTFFSKEDNNKQLIKDLILENRIDEALASIRTGSFSREDFSREKEIVNKDLEKFRYMFFCIQTILLYQPWNYMEIVDNIVNELKDVIVSDSYIVAKKNRKRIIYC